MPIFDKEKMKQKVVYPTEQTPSYADWALFEMGKELEESGSGGTAYTAGSGIAISEENVISNTAQPDVTKEYVDGADVNLQQQIQGKVNINLDNVNVGSATAGQVVKVNNSANGVEFGDVPKELPPIASGDAGKVLQVNSGETGVEWNSVNEVPAPTASDVNKVLTATGANAFAWREGGSSGVHKYNITSVYDLVDSSVFIGIFTYNSNDYVASCNVHGDLAVGERMTISGVIYDITNGIMFNLLIFDSGSGSPTSMSGVMLL